MHEKLKWKDYGGKHFESAYTSMFQSYILVKKFKIDKRKLHLSALIRSNQISREDALKILKKLNNKPHFLISSVCISRNGSMIWNYTDKAKLIMKNFSEDELKNYLAKISDEALYAYNVYQIEGEGRNLFASISGDEDTIMGLPIKKIKEYLKNYNT